LQPLPLAAALARRAGRERAMRAISVVVPVYNSEATLAVLVSRLEPVLSKAVDRFELILVNDGSRDGSWAVIEQLCRQYHWIHAFNLMRNYGQHNALLCGIRAAQYPLVVTMDDDCQHPPEVLPDLLTALTDDFDVMYGVPQHEQHGVMRDVASQITKLALQSAMGAETSRHVSAFRMFRTQLRDAFASYRSPFVSIDVMLTWATRRFGHIKVPHAPRLAGVSNYTVKKLIIHAINMATGFSVLPLQLASLIGFGFTVLGICSLLFVVIRFLVHGGSVPGFPFLAALISIFSGAQLFALGVIGEYLARMHFRVMDKPAYVIRDSYAAEAAVRAAQPPQSMRPPPL
jgi:glycosyltransferase involved in cell wall biosynthesis